MEFNVKRLFLIQNFVYGFGLKSKSKIKNLNLLLIRLINLILLGFVIVEIVTLFPEAQIIEFACGYVIDTTVCLVIYFNLIFKYEKICQIYDALIESTDYKFKSKIMKIGKVFTLLWFFALPIGIMTDFTGNLYLQKIGYFKSENSYRGLIQLIANLFNYYYLTVGVSVYAILNYTFIHLFIYLKFKHSIKYLFPKINENGTFENNLMRFNLVKMNKILTRHQEIRKQINDLMGIFPFLTISGIFLNACLRLTLFATINTKTSYLFINSADFITLAFFNLFMIIILSFIPSENNIFSELISSLKKANSMIGIYSFNHVQNNLLIEKIILFKLIHCPCYAQHNAWEMFCINKTFILSFIAAVTTFSVMLIQIKQSIK